MARLLTIAVPVFDEAATLRAAIERLLAADLPVPVEVLVVDDGSTDGSLDSVADLAEAGAFRVLRHRRNRGKGAAVRTALAEAGGDLFAVLDADLEYDPADYRTLLQPILAGRAGAVYGSRGLGPHTAYSFWHVVGNRVVNLWASVLYNAWVSDLETCMKVAPTDLWRAAALRSEGFAIEAELTARLLRAGHHVYEMPVSYRARGRDEGKKLRARDGVVALWVLSRIRLSRSASRR